MKMLVAGVQRIAGTSKAGSPFDMCNVLALVPVEIVNGKVQVNGVGFKLMELPLELSALPEFMQIPPSKFPLELDLITDARPRMGKLETVCTGFVKPLKQAA